MRVGRLFLFFAFSMLPFSVLDAKLARRSSLSEILGLHKNTPQETPNREDTRLMTKILEMHQQVEKEIEDLEKQVDLMKEKYGKETPVFYENEDKEKNKSTAENPLPNEMNYPGIFGNDGLKNEFDKGDHGDPNKVGSMPTQCEPLVGNNASGITFVQPSSVNESGAVLFGGHACTGVKRRNGQFNNWPSDAVNGLARMTPNGMRGKHSQNYDKGVYGDSNNDGLNPIWLGDSGAVQIHSLRNLGGDSGLNGISSMGCLVVNQNCMNALNDFLKDPLTGQKRDDLKFKIVTSDNNPTANDACTRAVNTQPFGVPSATPNLFTFNNR